MKATPRFIKSLHKLDTLIKRRILDKASELAANPHAGKMLKGELRGLLSMRVGDYRVIYLINEKEDIIWLVNVDHRKRVCGRV